MKKIIISLGIMLLTGGVVIGATSAYFSDTETSAGNTFTAGTLDLKVNGNDDVLPMVWGSGNMVPGEIYNAGTVEVHNNGSIPGKITLMVSNVISNENGELEPELSWSGTGNRLGRDLPDTEVDPTGYDNNTGYGELWDQMGLKFYVDLNDDGVMQWNEPVVWGGAALDMTSSGAYHIPTDTNLFPANQGFDETLNPGESFKIGLLATFFNDTSSIMSSQPQFNGLNNNMTMSDDAVFDVIFGLEQIITP
jgi:predicted ribosomally synthesized peptide with SipW-like signal peptide